MVVGVQKNNQVAIIVGSGESEKFYQLAGAELDCACRCSGYFASRRDRSIIELPESDPEEFEIFLEWVSEATASSVFTACGRARAFSTTKPPDEPWISNGADICLLAMLLKAADFEKYALAMFISSCALAPFGPWSKIERRALAKTPLRRFSNHWVAWNFHLSGCRRNEYTHLQAAALASQVSDKTRDPRVYDLAHWFSTCGDSIEPGCSHDAISRQEKLNAAKLSKNTKKLIDPVQALQEMMQETGCIELHTKEQDNEDNSHVKDNEAEWEADWETDDG